MANMSIKSLVASFIHKMHFRGIKRLFDYYERIWFKEHMGHCGSNVYFGKPLYLLYPQKILLEDNTTVNPGATFIISPFSEENVGRFIMKKNATCAQNLTVINHNHTTHPKVGVEYKKQSTHHEGDSIKDIIIEEDAFVGANVTICAGVIVGRGAIVGAGSVLRKSVPPYSITYGNPATHKKFIFSPEQIINHEKTLYPEEERLSLEKIIKIQTETC